MTGQHWAGGMGCTHPTLDRFPRRAVQSDEQSQLAVDANGVKIPKIAEVRQDLL